MIPADPVGDRFGMNEVLLLQRLEGAVDIRALAAAADVVGDGLDGQAAAIAVGPTDQDGIDQLLESAEIGCGERCHNSAGASWRLADTAPSACRERITNNHADRLDFGVRVCDMARADDAYISLTQTLVT